MYRAFPRDLLSTIGCPQDGAELQLSTADGEGPRVGNGTLTCRSCGRAYRITEGILDLFESQLLDDESRNEHDRRDQGAVGAGTTWEQTAFNAMEIEPTMRASAPLRDALVLEFGAGMGRHTVRMLEQGARVVALDFSRESLRKLARRVDENTPMGLVHADCTHFSASAGAFDLVASTLVSNLPTARHRAALFASANRAVKRGGRFVFGVHNHGFWNWYRGEPKAGHYREVPIFRQCFTPLEIAVETRAYFREVEVTGMQVVFPLTMRFRFPVIAMSRIAGRLPLLPYFGELLLVVARAPEQTAPKPTDSDSTASQLMGARS